MLTFPLLSLCVLWSYSTGDVVYSVGKLEEATPPPYHDLERTPRPLGNNVG